MIKKLFKYKLIFLSIIFIFLFAIFFCGNDYTFRQHTTLGHGECTQVLSNMATSTKDNIAFKVILAFISAFTLAGLFQNTLKAGNYNKQIVSLSLRQRWQFLYKLFHPIFQALRRRKLNPTIYDSFFAIT